MAHYYIPTKEFWNKEQKRHGYPANYDVFFETFICDICGEHMKEYDAYYVVRTDEQVKQDRKTGYRHVKCDTTVSI